MGAATREEGVLKLVHPGKYVEIHREPIAATEVLRKNPRHCITRPDVFEFPWIVVKPDSVLVPGRVFFIVPNLTMYNLLKQKELSNHLPPSPPTQCLNNCVQLQLFKQNSPIQTYAGMTPKNQNHNKFVKKLTKMSCQVASLCEHDGDNIIEREPPVESSLKVIKYENTDQNVEQQSRSYNDTEYEKSSKHIRVKSPKNDDNLEFMCSKQVTMMKSCLRKPDSVRKSLNLKVSFVLPIRDEEQQRRLTDCRTYYTG
ncbi:Odorant receptor 33c like [Quillaja saponaria]|uniref:Odorant receptor 33c like n=1 Tax=Quillaja saponaria TaxID=32244 RepID=A0AAD7PCE1_QUISA|nr:Odorant receptor 33c like [Quillaja saponaria]KAJ7950428.1 Odorant receptor 33c like [Quillaja saponaria]